MNDQPAERATLLYLGVREWERDKPLRHLWYDLTGIENDGSPLTGTNDPETPENNRAAGYCSDVTCPHNDHLQRETWTEV